MPVARLHTRRLQSEEPDTRVAEEVVGEEEGGVEVGVEGRRVSPVTAPVWPLRLCKSSPVSTRHTWWGRWGGGWSRRRGVWWRRKGGWRWEPCRRCSEQLVPTGAGLQASRAGGGRTCCVVQATPRAPLVILLSTSLLLYLLLCRFPMMSFGRMTWHIYFHLTENSPGQITRS